MLQQRIQVDAEAAKAVDKALPIVGQLAVERAKKWPRNIHLRAAHRGRIGSLEAELERVAEDAGGLTGNEIEQLGRAELKRRNKFLPAVQPDLVSDDPAIIRAEGEVNLVRDILKAEEAKLARVRLRIDGIRADLRTKEQAVERLRDGKLPATSSRLRTTGRGRG